MINVNMAWANKLNGTENDASLHEATGSFGVRFRRRKPQTLKPIWHTGGIRNMSSNIHKSRRHVEQGRITARCFFGKPATRIFKQDVLICSAEGPT